MPRKRSELEREDKIAEILAVAQRQLAEGGYRNLSVKALASELGLAQAAVYWYFPTKDHVFVTAVENSFMDAWSRKPKTATLEKQVQWFGDELVSLHPYISALRERAAESEVARTFLAGVETTLLAILGGALQAQTSAAKPSETAEMILAILEGLAARRVPPRRRRALVAAALAELAPRAPDTG
ncbi:MAG: hypothetical protein QOI95_2063 [Acidimicrobiaceae bacterium]